MNLFVSVQGKQTNFPPTTCDDRKCRKSVREYHLTRNINNLIFCV